ncbi:DUF1684 domain-containing protein [uncultured Agrococcus sp.]|uniref:DUF1684 domain-containing protein n=1 Tax=uncultured Agrococcus sp. TaxID=382258 RepID=UPI0025EFBFB6|nr:DUF1684 domain-containing protein [uncultured Agrococcus sp.]
MTDARSQFDAFRKRREEAVRGPQGNLALALTEWVTEATDVDSVPGTWAPSPAGEGLLVSATDGDDIIVDGHYVDGTATVYTKTSMTPSSVHFGDGRTGLAIADGDRVALRVWDPERAEQLGFEGLDYFDFDPEWQLTGRFEPVDEGVDFEHERSQGGKPRDAKSPGIVHFEHEGEQYELLALRSGDSLQIVFADVTTGDDTYGVGRFLFARPDDDGSVDLDFNRAIVPPCSMSDQFNCPLPPPSNRFSFRVEAGEKKPMFAKEPAREA